MPQAIQAILDAIKKYPGALFAFVTLTAATWLVFQFYVGKPLSGADLRGAVLFWALVVFAVTFVRSLFARRKEAASAEKPVPPAAPPASMTPPASPKDHEP